MVRKYTPQELEDDCLYAMIEERGLQFVLPKARLPRYLVWTRRPEEHKQLIRETIAKFKEQQVSIESLKFD